MTVASTKNGVDSCTGSTLESALYLLPKLVNFRQCFSRLKEEKVSFFACCFTFPQVFITTSGKRGLFIWFISEKIGNHSDAFRGTEIFVIDMYLCSSCLPTEVHCIITDHTALHASIHGQHDDQLPATDFASLDEPGYDPHGPTASSKKAVL